MRPPGFNEGFFMDAPKYSPKQVAEMLGMPLKSFDPALKQDSYSGAEVWALREQYNRFPEPLGGRKQLFLNLKGGTGKTSLSTSYAWRLAELGHRVLLVDLDSQGHATKCLGYEGGDFQHTLLNVLVKKMPLSEVIQQTDLPNLEFVPSNLSMSGIDLALMPLPAGELKLRNALREVEGDYDVIVFDAPPSLSLININALVTANDLFAPVLADFLSFHGFKLLTESMEDLYADVDAEMENIFVVVNAFNATFRLAKDALEALRETYPKYLLPTIIRQCTKFAQASSEGRPIFVEDPSSKGAMDIDALIQHVLPRLRAGSGPGSDTETQQAG